MEQFLKNKKIGKKLKFVFGAIIIIMVIAIFASVMCIILINRRMTSFYNGPYVNYGLQMEIRKDTQYVGRQMLWAMTTDDLTETGQHIAEADTYGGYVQSNVAKLKENFPNQELAERIEAAAAALSEERANVSTYAVDNRNDEALEIYNGAYNDALNNFQNVLIEAGEYANTVAATAYQQAMTLKTIAIIVMSIIGICCTLFCINMGLLLTKSIEKPVAELDEAADKLSRGELDAVITYDADDELGNLARSFREAFAFMNDVIADTIYLLSALAEGKFGIKSQKADRYIGEFAKIIETMRITVTNLDGAMKQINESSEQVAMGATQMAESAQSLAEGATEQAGAIEELTATVENVNSMAQDSAAAAQSAAEHTMTAAKEAAEGKGSMEQLVVAMSNISEVSMEIQKIIGAIEDIASQTNLLSLNASIEAARAGEAGKGFAVVADQIGKLAADSAQSAVQTRELISKSLEEVGHGNEMTKTTVEAFEKIIDSMNAFAEMASGARDSSMAQADILKQVQDGIEQIAEVVQTNSAAAEETSATSEELSAQADTLKSLVAHFELRD